MSARSSSHLSCSTSPRCAIELDAQLDARQLHAILTGRRRSAKQVNRQPAWPCHTQSGPVRSAVAAAAVIGSSNGKHRKTVVEAPAGTAASVGASQHAADSGSSPAHTEFVAETLLPTTSGKFRLRGYRHTVQVDGSLTVSEPSVIMTGKPEGNEHVVLRVHDACFTSEVLGSLKCDCADQLQLAMDYIQDNPGGLIIYLQQEGRGIGLANKIAAYALQEKGLDTVDANRKLGLPDDAREYTSVRNILADLGIKSVRLMTNNPRKIEVLQALGVEVTDRIPCIVKAQQHNLGYLSTKRARMRHLLSPQPELDGSYCIWNHEGEALQPSVISGNGPLGALISERDAKAAQPHAASNGAAAAPDSSEAVSKPDAE